MKFIRFTSIESERLRLRKFRESDAEAFYIYRTNPQVTVYQGEGWNDYTYGQALEFVKSQSAFRPDIPGTWFQIAIELKATRSLIGDCAIHTLAPGSNQVEIGYTISPGYQGRGYGYEAVWLLLDYIFGVLRKNRVVAVTDVRNAASIGLLEKLGMRREERLVKNAVYGGGYAGEYLYAMLRGEWSARRIEEGFDPLFFT